MKKAIQALITGFLIAVLAIVASPTALSQQTYPLQSASPASQEGTPVVFEGEPLFIIKTSFGSLTLQQRQQKAEQRITEFANDYAIPLADLEVTSMDETGIPVSLIVAESNVVFFVTEQDAKLTGIERQALANEYAQKIRSAVERYRQERSFEYLVQSILYSIIATLALILFLWMLNKVFNKIYRWLLSWEESHIQAVRWENLELIGSNQLDKITKIFTKMLQAVITLKLLIAYLAFVLKQFPATRNSAGAFWVYCLEVLQQGWQMFVAYLPSLFTIILVVGFT